ncbi:hypothetical protein BDP55DRAFT_504655, partial [Colletotrichum godetiae]
LKGANLAFNKTKPKPIPPPKPTPNAGNITRRRGASLIAASAASNYDRSTSTSPVQRQHTGASLATTPGDSRFGRDGTSNMRDRLSNFLASSPAASSTASHLTPHTTRLDPKSPSYIAATLAASRSASPSPQPHASPAASALTPAQINQLQQMQLARKNRRGSVGETESVVSSLDLPDETSIPATGHLISMFERGEGEDVDPVKRSGGDVAARPKVRPLTPERELSPARAKAARMGIVDEEGGEGERRPAVSKTKPRVKPRPVTPNMVVRKEESKGDITPQAGKPTLKSSPAKPVLSPAKAVHRQTVTEQSPHARGRQTIINMSSKASEAPEVRSRSQLTRVPITQTLMPEPKVAQPPTTPEPRRSRAKAKPVEPVSPPLVERPGDEIATPELKRPASKARVQPPTPPQPRGTKSIEREPPPLTKPRSMASVYGHAHFQEPFRRSESGPRPSTADTSSSNDTFVSAESNQTAVPEYAPSRPTPRQTNSTHSTPGRSPANSSPSRTTPRRTPASSTTSLPLNSLSNAIMAGSLAAARLTPSNTGNSTLSPPQLPNHTKSPRMRQTLRQPPHRGMLGKAEFVVGLWLIDQRLRGRKIPARVSASVWDSAQGVKVLSPKVKK